MSETRKDSKPSGKGRPTPKRKDREKANFKPLVGKQTKEAAAEARAKRAEASKKARAAMLSGDERYLLARDRGPQRKAARELLDGSYTFTELLMIIMVLFMVASAFISDRATQGLMVNIMFGVFFVCIFEITYFHVRLRKKFKTQFPDEPMRKGTWLYLMLRGMQPRPMRIPKPGPRRNKNK
ncbi:MAG: hypothetical protein RIQ88_564 [Actinomycetota bacterium]|jgi:Flp pilus assembly protein TadB